MGIESDQEMLQLIGTEDEIMSAMMTSIEESHKLGIHFQQQAIKYISGNIKQRRGFPSTSHYTSRTSPEDYTMDILANIILAHVPVII